MSRSPRRQFSLARQRAYLTLSLATRGMTLGVRGAAFDREGRVFLVRHSYVPGWYLPGGGVDPGETMEEALLRELREEGGISVAGRPQLFGIYLNRPLSRRDHVALYVCRDVSADPAFRATAEIVEFGFFPPHGLPPDATDGTRRRLAEILSGEAQTAEW